MLKDIQQEVTDNFGENAMKSIKKYAIYSIAGTAALALALNSYTTVDSGETVRIQNNLTGGYEWHQTEGVKFKAPFFSRVDVYNTVSTVAVTDDHNLIKTSSATRQPMLVTFADNYGGDIEASWRVKLPTGGEKLEAFHQDVKGQKNYEGNTLLTFAKDMLNLTTDQFLAQDFMQGGKGAFKQRLSDQAEYGMLVTKREKVIISDNTADNSLSSDRSQSKTAAQYAYRVVIQTDETGKPLRRPHSLTKYGLSITQTDLGEFMPSPDLQKYVSKIKGREQERADTIAEQRTEREKAITEQLKGDRERVTAKNKALMEKDRKVIQGQQAVELAGIQAERERVERQKVSDLAKIDKQRELDIAKSNEGIQKANAMAAKYEAQAIKEKGLAQASVTKAKYNAIDKDIKLAELDLEAAKAIAKALPHINIEMPQMVINGNGQGSVSDLLNVKLVKDLMGKQPPEGWDKNFINK